MDLGVVGPASVFGPDQIQLRGRDLVSIVDRDVWRGVIEPGEGMERKRSLGRVLRFEFGDEWLTASLSEFAVRHGALRYHDASGYSEAGANDAGVVRAVADVAYKGLDDRATTYIPACGELEVALADAVAQERISKTKNRHSVRAVREVMSHVYGENCRNRRLYGADVERGLAELFPDPLNRRKVRYSIRVAHDLLAEMRSIDERSRLPYWNRVRGTQDHSPTGAGVINVVEALGMSRVLSPEVVKNQVGALKLGLKTVLGDDWDSVSLFDLDLEILFANGSRKFNGVASPNELWAALRNYGAIYPDPLGLPLRQAMPYAVKRYSRAFPPTGYGILNHLEAVSVGKARAGLSREKAGVSGVLEAALGPGWMLRDLRVENLDHLIEKADLQGASRFKNSLFRAAMLRYEAAFPNVLPMDTLTTRRRFEPVLESSEMQIEF